MEKSSWLGVVPFVWLAMLVIYGVYSIFHESLEEGCQRIFKLNPSNPLCTDDVDSILSRVGNVKGEFDRWSDNLRTASSGPDLDYLEHIKFEFDYAEQVLCEVTRMAKRVFKSYAKDRPELVDNVQQLAYPAEQNPFAE